MLIHTKTISILVRHIASVSSKHPFPFPFGTNPTPHEIFHLPRSASQDEIKLRYFELVKLYHPDAIHYQHDVSPSVCNARFRAITHAYGVLRGRHCPSSNPWEVRDEAIRAELRHRSRRSRSASATMTADSASHADINDSHLQFSLIAFLLAGTIAAMSSISSHMDRVERHTQTAAANLAQARTDAQVYGMERRRKIHERVKALHESRETMDAADIHQTSKVWLDELSRR